MDESEDQVDKLLERLEPTFEGVDYGVVISTCLSIVANLCTGDNESDGDADLKALRASTGLALINLAGYLHHLNDQNQSRILLPH